MSSNPPPFVLVHGAFHGGWCWSPVARLLRRREHDVFTPTQTGLGERRHLMSGTIDMETFVLDILNVIEFEQLEDIILVGHSFGARTVSGVVDRAPSRIRRTVFLDGGLPLDGLSRLDSMTAEARDARIKSAMNFDGGISVPPPPPGNFGIVDPQMSHRVKSLLTPHPLNTERTAVPLKNPLGNGRPTTYVRCIDPAFPAVEISARHARSRSDWRYVELGAGHDAMLTHPQLLAELLLAEAAS